MRSFLPEDHPVSAVVDGLRRAGFRALLAGGAVRDRLLGRPAADFDVATSAEPNEVKSVFAHVVPVGEEFGVVLVLIDGHPIEVATFRSDARYDDGRHPIGVTFSRDPEEDALRRDFTINALFFDPVSSSVLDYTGGREDLDRRLVRAVGDPVERFAEDRLRMLRAVRFAAKLDFEITEETWAAICALSGDIADISGERIRDELMGILAGPDPVRGIRMLLATGLLEEILPEVAATVDVPQPARFHPEGDVYSHTLAAIEFVAPRTARLALAALLHDVGKPVTLERAERLRFDRHAPRGAEMGAVICRRLRMSRDESEAICELVHDHLRFMGIPRMREARARRFLTGKLGPEHIALHYADCRASHGKLSNWEYSRARVDEWSREPPTPEKLVTGRDLVNLGLVPGPAFAPLLAEVEDLTLEKKLGTREEALEWLRRRVAEGDSSDEE